jgi:AraC-like DNA-binding protein
MVRRSPKAATEIAQYDREAQALELRARGYTFSAIAAELDFADASGASRAYHRALGRKPAQNVEEIREQEASRIEFLWRKTADLIEHPKLAHSAIGKTIPDPRSPGEYLIDQSAQIAAMREYRLQSESYRKMCGADLHVPVNPNQDPQIQEVMDYVQGLTATNQRLERENTAQRLELESLRLEVSAMPADVV